LRAVRAGGRHLSRRRAARAENDLRGYPQANDAGVRRLLERSFRIDRFLADVLVDDPSVILFDR
jgi:hypothetical protein